MISDYSFPSHVDTQRPPAIHGRASPRRKKRIVASNYTHFLRHMIISALGIECAVQAQLLIAILMVQSGMHFFSQDLNGREGGGLRKIFCRDFEVTRSRGKILKNNKRLRSRMQFNQKERKYVSKTGSSPERSF